MLSPEPTYPHANTLLTDVFQSCHKTMHRTSARAFRVSLLTLFVSIGTALAQSFTHPGALNTQADFDRIKAKVDAHASPWYDSYLTLCNDNQTSLGHGWNAVTQIVRGSGGGNFALSQRDALCIYLMAVRWRLSGDPAYAEKAIEGMDRWSSTMTSGVTGDNWGLASGLCGYEFAVAGETLRGYSGWSQTSINNYKAFLMRFYPQCNDWLYVNHGGWDARHARSNWDIANMAAMAAIGVFCDDRAIFNKAIDYFKAGPGNGQIQKWCWYLFPEGIGQQEESTRDQAHAGDAVASMAMLCQIADSQGLDLYGYDNNRFLKAAEYYAKFNSNIDVPWMSYDNRAPWPGQYLEANIGWAQRGAFLPVWDMLNTHFIKKGIYAPYTAAFAASRRPTGNIGNWNSPDYFGFDTLTHYEEPPTTDAPPSSLWVNFDFPKAILSWWGSPRASGYTIKRATVSGGPYTTIGTTNASTVTFVDDQVQRGQTYYYVVSATTPSGKTANSAQAIGGCVTRYNFEGNAADSAGAFSGTLASAGSSGLPGFTTGQSGGQALQLNGIDQYVSLPLGAMTYHDITLSAWIKWGGGNAWQRIFDTSDPNHDRVMFLTVSDGSKMKFFISNGWGTNDATLVGPVPATNTWTHVAVTIKSNIATLFQNGVPVDTKSVGTEPMFGQTYTYIGKSAWSNDPYFKGSIDDFRIYNQGLSGADVYALWGQSANAAPVFTTQFPTRAAATEDAAYTGQTLAGAATDANGGTLTYSKLFGPAWLLVAANGALSGTPANADVGDNTFSVRVTDSSGATDDAELTIPVINSNDAPTWNANPFSKPAVTQTVAYAGTIARTASDVDVGDTLSYSKVSGPAWLSVAANGALTGTPTAGDVGTNNFVVRVTDAAGATADATLTIAVLAPSIQAQYLLDGSPADNVGGATATITGTPAYVAGVTGQALDFDGTSNYATLGTLYGQIYKSFTVSAWVWWDGGNAHQRIFDFGNGTGEYLFLTPSNGSVMRFGIKEANSSEQFVATTALPIGQWQHVAVTFSGNTATIYVNGVAKASNTGITLSPANIALLRNYIGKSQWPDPLFNGRIDDFRLYNYALSSSEMTTLFNAAPAIVPSAVTGVPTSSKVTLHWNPSVNAATYTVKRGTVSGGPYTTIASGLTSANYVDTAVTTGTRYYYVVSSTNPNGESANSPEDSVVLSDLLAFYKFNETSGTVATDASGNGFDGTLVNSPTLAAGLFANAVTLPNTGAQHVTLPTGIVNGLTDFTISTWVKIGAFSTFSRIFDFGTGTTNYLFLTPQYTGTAPNTAKLRFAIRTPSVGEQQINSSTAFATGTWVHVAVTLNGNTGRLYLNGIEVGSNTGMTLKPSSLGSTTLNYLGRSQFGSDPYLNGSLDDFRIYSRALNAAEISAQAAPTPSVPTGLAAIPGDGQATLNWSIANSATAYTVKRGNTPGGPYTAVPAGTGIATNTFTDTGLTNGPTYYYVVSATNWTGASADSAEVAVTPSYLRVQLKFDETSGTVAADSSGHQQNAALFNAPGWITGKIDNALTLTKASSQYATLPDGVVSTLSDITISAWVKPATLDTWARVFDFGSGMATNLFFTTRSGATGKPQFAIRVANSAEQIIAAPNALPLNTWTHIAVTLSGSTGTLYINGVASGTNTAMTLKPSDMGNTTQNYLGKSQYNDPYLNGAIDDFRIYSCALNADEIASLVSGQLNAPQNATALPGDARIDLSWQAVATVRAYTIQRSTFSGGPYEVVGVRTSAGHIDSGLPAGTTYYYVVSAEDAAGETASSSEISATTYTAVENWRVANFGTASNNGNAADSADPDGDGMTNAQEYTAGTDPKNGVSALRVSNVSVGNQDLVVNFSTVSGKTYRLERSDTMASGSWTTVQSDIAGTGGVVQVADANGAAQTKRFYRIVVVP